MSNAFDKASLVMLPHAYEDGKVYSLKPTDRSGDFTFSRGSDTATRVGEDGYIKKEIVNLLLQSNSFDTTWAKINSTLTSGQSGYDGSSDAWLLEADSDGPSRYVGQNVSSSGVNTFSCYAKAGTTDYFRIQINAGSTAFAYFDLTAGVADSTLNEITTNIEAVSGATGWYLCSLVANDSSISAVRIYVARENTANVIAGDNLYIQDAQLNQGLVAQDYLETTTAPVYGGLTDNMPRLDYTDATCPSLLLEPSRTNILPYSEYLGTGISTNGCTQTITNETNPSGNDVSYLVGAIDDVNDQIRYDKFGLSSGSYFISVFVKGDGNANEIRMRGTGTGTTTGNVYWDVAADGTITLDTSASPSGVNAITESYGNGWYRIGLEETFDGTGRIAIYPSRGGVNISTYIWGLQWEAGSYPTSYIPTYGSTQTRAGESVTATGLSEYLGDSEGTLYIEAEQFQNTGFVSIIEASNSGVSMGVTGANTFIFNVRVSGTNQADIQSGAIFSANTNFKLAGKYKANDFEFFKDGVSIGTDTSGNTFGDGDLITIQSDSSFPSSQPFYGRIKQILVFPEALSDSELQALTTL